MLSIPMDSELFSLAQQLLVPPGLGVYTVHTAQNKKNALHQRLYGTIDPAQVRVRWLEELSHLLQSNQPATALLGIPSDCGGGILRGANWGPLALRSVLQESVADLGDVRVIPHYLYDSLLSDRAIKASREALYGSSDTSLPVSPLSIAEYFLTKLYEQAPQVRIFGLGGDHSVSYPLVKTYLQARKKQNKRCALIHFDAHTDLLPSRLGVDICFGSWTHHVLPFLESPSDLYQIGIRSSAKDRAHWENTLGIHQSWGPVKDISPILEDLKKKNIREVYVSFDIDVLDISEASATGTPESGGLETNTAVEIIEKIKSEVRIGGADLAEVAPYIHHEHVSQAEPETTLANALKIMHALGISPT